MVDVSKPLLRELRKYLKADVAKKEASNAFNAQKTVFKNKFTDFIRDNSLPAETVVQLGVTQYGYGPSVSITVNPEVWYDLWKKKKITKEQFFEALSVRKGDADRIMGKDQIESIADKGWGKQSDVRTREADINVKTPTVILPKVIEKPKPRIKSRRVIKARRDTVKQRV